MKPSLLITGASGFIGSHLIEEALLQGYKVFAAIRPSSKFSYSKHPDVQVVYLDYSDATTLANHLIQLKEKYGKFQYVIHNAGTTRSQTIDGFNQVNNIYPQNLLKALQHSDIIPDKFILVSSMAAFGPGDSRTMLPITTNQKMKPISEYGNSKKLISHFLLKQTKIPYTIVYPTAVYGPKDKDFIEFVKLINKGFEPYLGLYQQVISMVHVKDLTSAIVGLLTKAPDNSQYIISDTYNYNKKELGKIVKSILHKKTIQVSIPVPPIMGIAWLIEKIYNIIAPGKMPLLTREKINEISCANWSCDAQDVWKILESRPLFNLQTGMENTIDWYREKGML